MLIFACLTEASGGPDGALLIKAGGIVPPGQSDPQQGPVPAAVLQEACNAYLAGQCDLLEMFKATPVGVVDDIQVAADGSVSVSASLTDRNTVKKASWAVYKLVALAVRPLARDPTDPNRITKAIVTGVSLVDTGNAETFSALAKAAGASGGPGPIVVSSYDCLMLDTNAKVLDLERQVAIAAVRLADLGRGVASVGRR